MKEEKYRHKYKCPICKKNFYCFVDYPEEQRKEDIRDHLAKHGKEEILEFLIGEMRESKELVASYEL